MGLAIELAEKGRLTVSPNPMVGCVIVKDDEILGRGFHRKSGEPHAEINALREAGDRARGAVMYVTLEPCCHQGSTPPCTEAVLASGIKQLVSAHLDPNPMVRGRGFEQLRKNGISVEVGILEENARRLNEVFIRFITSRRPFVTLKLAATLDGKIATRTGDSRWITNEASRRIVHQLRYESDAVTVGIGTALADDPSLTARHVPDPIRQPIRIVLDSKLRLAQKTKMETKIVRDAEKYRTIIVTTQQANTEKIHMLEDKNLQIWIAKSCRGHVDLTDFLEKCGNNRITSLFVEGGSELAASFLREKRVDKLLYFLAPKLIGGDGVPAIRGLGIDRIEQAIFFEKFTLRHIDNNILFEGYLK